MQNIHIFNSFRRLIPSILGAAALLLPGVASAQSHLNVRFGNEASDTLKINSILLSPEVASAASGGDLLAAIGRKFIGVPYKAHTLEHYPEKLTVYCDSLDCTTFIETVIALGMTVKEERNSWRDFVRNLQRIRYRSGEIDGYPSRLHYISDWTVDNARRENFREVTKEMPGAKPVVRTIDFMTRHRDLYPALADSANFERVKSTEGAYRNHRFFYVPSAAFFSKPIKGKIQNGDIVALVSNMKDLDVTHMGMIVIEPDGEAHLLHASMSNGKVEISALPLNEFLRRNRSIIGLRIYRLW